MEFNPWIIICFVHITYIGGSNPCTTCIDKGRSGIRDVTTVTLPTHTTLINLNNNNLEHIPSGVFKDMPNVTWLNLAINQINRIDDNSFINIPSLTQLFLQKNKLKVLKANMFNGLVNLLEFKLHDNEIYFIQLNAFSQLTSLFILYLNENNLAHIHKQIFDHSNYQTVNSLPAVHLDGNPLKCNCDLSWIIDAQGTWLSFYGQCGAPASLAGHLLTNITPQQIVCPTVTSKYLFYRYIIIITFDQTN